MDNVRHLQEVISLYNLEPDLFDIYVEGKTDQLIIQRYIKKYSKAPVRVKDINQIDFSKLYEQNPELRRNNKLKVIALCKEMGTSLKAFHQGVICIIDRDYDKYLCNECNEPYLIYTDYNSFDLYLYDKNVLDIFYENFLGGFPLDGNETLRNFEPILIEIFLIRLTMITLSIEFEYFVDITKTLSVNRRGRQIQFDSKLHVEKIINKTPQKNIALQDFFTELEEHRLKLDHEVRLSIRGHDFIDLLYELVCKLKTANNISHEHFSRCLFQSIDYSELRRYELFSKIEKKYF